MKNVKTQLHDYPNMNVIKLSMVIILNYGYGINIICRSEMFQYTFHLVVWTKTLRHHCM